MTMTTHLRILDRTLCGVKASANGSLKTTQWNHEVTCKRCLVAMPPRDEPKVEQTSTVDDMIAILKSAVDAALKITTIQERMTDVAKRVAVANKGHWSLTLSAEEVEALALLIALLNAQKS